MSPSPTILTYLCLVTLVVAGPQRMNGDIVKLPGPMRAGLFRYKLKGLTRSEYEYGFERAI